MYLFARSSTALSSSISKELFLGEDARTYAAIDNAGRDAPRQPRPVLRNVLLFIT